MHLHVPRATSLGALKVFHILIRACNERVLDIHSCMCICICIDTNVCEHSYDQQTPLSSPALLRIRRLTQNFTCRYAGYYVGHFNQVGV
ncbi:hypothetical protein POVWA1_020990 [Plasmodium ovale wallikeri]|uniref:Uncharacterized protein n=1 Tax=Plasmodium ovale wallikeri TaxID=864142 RepID=A0A1A8YRD5_PLAOA|nr:hypothetical protein POVWA1_020990 [Plasmodium ovale wallikeri]